MKSNITIVKELYLAFADSDFISAGALMHPQIVWEQMKGFPGGRKYVGASMVMADLFQSFITTWDYWHAHPESFFDTCNWVFVRGKYSAKNRQTGKQFTVDFIHEYLVNNGLLVYFKQYTDTYIIRESMS
jgi:ketosteroid isomerase-like protein